MHLKSFLFILCLSILNAGLISTVAHAQGIRIVDCQGKTKAYRSQISPTDNNISVDVVNSFGQKVSSGEISLFNSKGQVIKAAISDGIAEFNSIEPGVWMISSDDKGLFFTQIAMNDLVPATFWQSAGSTLTKVAEIALVVGVVVGATIAIDEATDGSGGGSSGNSGPPDTCSSCDPDLIAPSIPEFE